MKKAIRNLLNMAIGPFNKLFFRILILINKKTILDRNNVHSGLSGDKILVLAPHIDDDIIGCGGGIIKYIQGKKDVHITYLTRSEKRGSGSTEKEIAEERKEEANLIADKLGMPRANLHFLSGEDGNLINSNIEKELLDVITEVKPDTIFLPVFIDTHIDHYSATVKLFNSYKVNPHVFAGTQIFLYESQSPITPLYSNLILDISDICNVKQELLKVYKSQNTDFKFVKNTNKVNAVAIGTKACEVFIRVPIEEYVKMTSKFIKDIGDYYLIKENLKANRDNLTLISSYMSSLKYKRELKFFNKLEFKDKMIES